MGIQNIQILINEPGYPQAQQALVALQEKLIAEHRRGYHTYGNMRRGCPLCQGH